MSSMTDVEATAPTPDAASAATDVPRETIPEDTTAADAAAQLKQDVKEVISDLIKYSRYPEQSAMQKAEAILHALVDKVL